jgi:hypothetical protein
MKRVCLLLRKYEKVYKMLKSMRKYAKCLDSMQNINKNTKKNLRI